jgi:putative phosphoesterase
LFFLLIFVNIEPKNRSERKCCIATQSDFSLNQKQRLRLGIISDTHGRLNPKITTLFAGIDAIIHAGDIGGPEILDVLVDLAPVIAVRGNMDGGQWAADLPGIEFVSAGGFTICVLHDCDRLDLDPIAAGIRVIISGHTHRPFIKESDGVLYVNPGSASMPRGGLAPSVALLSIAKTQPAARIHWLE